jgi:2-(1,2-epoxy-1,2-dihydrophenyl)acetyl-CoA isomerase
MAKQMLNRSADLDLRGALEQEASGQAIAITSEDHQEGLEAFFAKRPPRFSGR